MKLRELVIMIVAFALILLCDAYGKETVTVIPTPITVDDDVHTGHAYVIGLLAGIDVYYAKGQPYTVLSIYDTSKPLFQDQIEVRVCGDQISNFAELYHQYLALVYHRSSPSMASGCHELERVYKVVPKETEAQ